MADSILLRADGNAVHALDRAVAEVLQVTGLPREQDVRAPLIQIVGHGWAGRKTPACRIMIDPSAFEGLDPARRADSLIKTWIHESIHGRQRFAPSFTAEWRLRRGFEEGLAEGLARAIAEALELRPALASFNFYVDAYRALARALDVPVISIWRCLWRCPPGSVSTGFIACIDAVMRSESGYRLSARQRLRLEVRARSLFRTANGVQLPDEVHLLRTWGEVLQ